MVAVIGIGCIGKTSLADAMLFDTGAVNRLGRVMIRRERTADAVSYLELALRHAAVAASVTPSTEIATSISTSVNPAA